MIICKVCNATDSPSWWKCCPEHTTEQGLDVVCQDCANKCISGKELVEMPNPMVDPRVVERLTRGDYSFGHAGTHFGNGRPDCPSTWHHHHDEFCQLPSIHELAMAGLTQKEFQKLVRSRA